jgi:hypothetical protein
MILRRFPWRLSHPDKDQAYNAFVQPNGDGAKQLFKLLPRNMRPVISRILIPDPKSRCFLEDVLDDEWVKSIDTCTPNEPSKQHHHHLLLQPSAEIMERGNIILLPPPPKEDQKPETAKNIT